MAADLRLVLVYRRLPKPRGGYRWPLEFGWQLAGDTGEDLNVRAFHFRPGPEHYLEYASESKMEAGYDCTLINRYNSSLSATYFLQSRVAYFGSRDKREQAVERLHRIHEDLNAALARWLEANAADPGDPVETVLDPASQYAAEPASQRVIRLERR